MKKWYILFYSIGESLIVIFHLHVFTRNLELARPGYTDCLPGQPSSGSAAHSDLKYCNLYRASIVIRCGAHSITYSWLKLVSCCQLVSSLTAITMMTLNCCRAKNMTHRNMVRLLSSLAPEVDLSIGPIKSDKYQYLQQSVVDTATFQRSLPRQVLT